MAHTPAHIENGFTLHGWRVLPRLNRVEKGAECHALKPRSMEVLVALASAGGEVVTRQQLMQAVWGRTEVTEDVLTQSIVQLRKVLGDDARCPEIIETIRKVGFRLLADVQPLETGPPVGLPPASSRRAFPVRWPMVIGAVAVVLAGIALRGRPTTAPAGDPPAGGNESVAIMPFANLSDDPANAYFSSGLSEEILNDLARIPGIKVPARISTSALAGRGLDVREIGRRLGVARVLEGSVRQSGSRLRVTAQLIDAATGYHIWSRSWDRSLDDVFVIQDEISSAITGMLLGRGSPGTARSPPNPRTRDIEAYNHYLLGRHAQKLGQFARAIEQFGHSVRADPRYAVAYAGLAEAYLSFGEAPYAIRQPALPDYYESLERAADSVEAALALDPRLTEAYLARAALSMARLDCESAGADLDSALALNPESARAHHQMGRYQMVNLHYDAARQNLLEALDRDPLNPLIASDLSRLYAWQGLYAKANDVLAQLMARGVESPVIYETLMLNADDFGRLDQRIKWGRELVRVAPDSASALAELGDAFSMLGMLDEADLWIAAAERISETQAFKARERWRWIRRRDADFLASADRMLERYQPAHDGVLSPVQSATMGIAAIARLQAGDPELAAIYVDRVIRQSPTLPYRGMHRVLYAEAVLARAQRVAGQASAASRTSATSLELGRRAREQTQADYPPLLRQLAVHHALRGEFDTALGFLQAAVEAGWRSWYLEARQPGADRLWQAFVALPGHHSLVDALEADLARMQERVRANHWDQSPAEFLGQAQSPRVWRPTGLADANQSFAADPARASNRTIHGNRLSPSALTAQRPSAGNPGAVPAGAPSQPAAIMATAASRAPLPGR